MNNYIFFPLAAFLVNFFFWVYVFATDRRSPVSRSFLLFCSVVILWEVGEVVMYVYPFTDVGLLYFKRVLSLLWGSLPLFLLIFMYALLDRPMDLIMKILVHLFALFLGLALFTDLVIAGAVRYSWGPFARPGGLYFPFLFLLFVVAGYAVVLFYKYVVLEQNATARKAKWFTFIFYLAAFFVIFSFTTVFPMLSLAKDVPVLSSSIFALLTVVLFFSVFRYNFIRTNMLQNAYTIFSQISDGVLILNGNHTIIEMNMGACKIMNCRTVRVKGRRIEEFFSEEYRFDEDYENSCFLLQVDGKTKLVMLSQSSIKWAFSARIIVMRDVTSHRLVEAALRESEARFRFLFEHAPFGVLYADNKGKIIDANQKLLEIMGSPSLEETKKINLFTFEPLKEAGVSAHFEECLSTGEVSLFEHYYTTKWGRTVYMRYYLVPVATPEIIHTPLDEKGHYGVLAIVNDFTAEKEAEEKIQQSQHELMMTNAARDKFFSIIAHDLRNPLTAIISFTHALSEDIDLIPKDKLVMLSKELNKTAENTSVFLENLLLWAKNQIGQEEYNPEQFFLSAIVGDLLAMMRAVSNEKNVALVNRMPETVCVYADSNMIKTVLRNLISNAVKFSYPGQRVELDAVEKEDQWCISVVDQGMGIKKENIEKLFRVDVKFSNLGTSNEKGSGLGLVLCRDFIEKNGGTFGVESVQGEGSCFSFTLPKAAQ